MVSYDQMKDILMKDISDYLSNNPKSIDPEKPKQLYLPAISYKQGTIEIRMCADKLNAGNFLEAIDLLKEYYKNFSGLRAYAGIYKITAELEDTTWKYKELPDSEKKQNETYIEFNFDHYLTERDFAVQDGGVRSLEKTNIVIFEKKAELKQEEINCVFDFWRKYVVGGTKRKIDPKEELRSLGVTIYEADGEFTWDSLAGYDLIKQQIKDSIILPFQNPEVYSSITKFTRTKDTKNIVRAVLFEGPPGTGKTISAKVIGNETKVPLVYVPIESIMSCWYGMAEKRLASIFAYCSQLEKAMIFLDEIDSLAGSRDKEMHEATRRILSVLLREIEGFSSSDSLLTLGATNTVKSLDKALLSRFDRIVSFPLPNAHERAAIFKYYAKQLDSDGLEKIAKSTNEHSGRDIEDICADAERVWARRIIDEKLEPSPPPLEVYLESLKQSKKILKPDKVMGFSTKQSPP